MGLFHQNIAKMQGANPSLRPLDQEEERGIDSLKGFAGDRPSRTPFRIHWFHPIKKITAKI